MGVSVLSQSPFKSQEQEQDIEIELQQEDLALLQSNEESEYSESSDDK